MSFQNLMPLTKGSLQFAQAGSIFVTKGFGTLAGAKTGHNGIATIDYLELLAGDACINKAVIFNSSNNTTGTLHFPEIEYFTSIKNYAIDTSDDSLIEIEISAESIIGDDLTRPDVKADYDPDFTTSNYQNLFHGDEVFGKFKRIAIYKTASLVYSGRVLIGKGPSSNLIKL
tara:strand:- start:633 stop:1148 length:516 start_codon:yes stop_codon:yes gene_type:complete